MNRLTFGKGMADPEGAIRNMRENCRRDLPWFVMMPEHERAIVIVGGGPSMLNHLGDIKRRQKQGADVVALNASWRVLVANGIRPNLISFLDPGEAVCGFIDEDNEQDDFIYLVASICHPKVLDKLTGRSVVVWHPLLGEDQEREQVEILRPYTTRPYALIGGGNTGALRWFYLAWLLGFRTQHFYGIDSSFSEDGRDHAYTKHDGPELESGGVVYQGKHYRCSPWMARQAHEFAINYTAFTDQGCKIQVHGEGLIPDMYRVLRAERKKAA